MTLTDAHGVVWDGKLKRLWAVGRDELVRCTYNGNKAEPKLEIEAHFKLPGYGGGHDLFSVPGSRKLFVTGEKVWVFNTETEMFSDFDQSNSIKSVSQRAANGPVIFMQATQSWWSDSIIFSGNSSKKTLKDAQFYKARWWVPNAFSTVE